MMPNTLPSKIRPLLSCSLFLLISACNPLDVLPPGLSPDSSPSPIVASASPSPSSLPTPLPDVSPSVLPTSLPSPSAAVSDSPQNLLQDMSTRWNVFKDANNKDLSLDRTRWFSENEGMGVNIRGSKADLYKTSDGGKNWQLVSVIDGQNNANDASMDVYIFAEDEIWYTTAFVGSGYSGTLGRSSDGGQTWQDLTEAAHKALADPNADTIYNIPFFNLVKSKGKIFISTYSDYLAVSEDNGKVWSRLKAPYSYSSGNAPDLIGTPEHLLLYYHQNKKNDLFRYSTDAEFIKTEAELPDSDDKLWHRSDFSNNGISFVNQRIYPWWGWPASVQVTADGGKTLRQVFYQADKEHEVQGLRDAKYIVNGTQTISYLSGIVKADDGKQYSQIRKSLDGGSSYTVVHSQPFGQQGYTTVALDNLNQLHAIRHWTDYYGNEYHYDAQYTLKD